MDLTTFDELEQRLKTEGPRLAIQQLCRTLREQQEYGSLFYALLLQKRHELGVSPVPTGPATELPPDLHQPYEDAIRDAGRLVGQLYLDQGDIPHAWLYFRMLGEPDPIVEALDRYQPGEEDDCQPIVDIAFNQGVHPRRGFDLILQRYGICSAITTMGGHMGGPEFTHGPEVREYCVQRLVRALHEQLVERLASEIQGRESAAPATRSIHELMAGRDWLFEEDFYHIDISHLSSVVQMSVYLSPGAELDLARELCLYGERLATRFKFPGDPPFEDPYRDYGVYLAVVAGDNVEAGLAHFRAKIEGANPGEIGTFPAEVLVNLLVLANQEAEALAVARQYLADVDERQLTCPSISELCRRLGDYRTLAEVARVRNDPVHFVAALIASGQNG